MWECVIVDGNRGWAWHTVWGGVVAVVFHAAANAAMLVSAEHMPTELWSIHN